MIYKKRSKPLILLGLESLIARLPNNHYHYPRIEEELRKSRAGFSGEMNFDKHINEFRPNYPLALMHDICLLQNGVYFQMDSVMILPDRLLIFEIKNLAGTLKIKAEPTQFIQENNGERKIIQSPVTELDRKKIFMDRWLKDRGISIPIEGIIGLAYTNELYIEKEIDTMLAFTQEIPIELYKLPIGNEQISKNDMRKLANEMISGHQEYNPFPLTKTMSIPVLDIKAGVICNNCGIYSMQWKKKRWNCNSCLTNTADSHLQLLNDWFYLIDNKITNRQFRSFSTITDPSVAKRMLKKSGLNMKGKARNAFYTR